MARAGDGWLIVIGLLLLAASGGRTPGEPARARDVATYGEGWVWPLPRLADGRRPRRTSGFGGWRTTPTPHVHVGIDVMYEREHRLPAGTKLPVPDHGSIASDLPDGTQVLAARDGTVWSTGQTNRGQHVVLDHGAPWSTFYQHLSAVYVRKGDRVEAGQPLGEAGFDPSGKEKVRHLHFELRDGKVSIDPEPMLTTAEMVEG